MFLRLNAIHSEILSSKMVSRGQFVYGIEKTEVFQQFIYLNTKTCLHFKWLAIGRSFILFKLIGIQLALFEIC